MCKIPDTVESPNLYQMVMHYQLHKCSAYCKRKTKCGPNKYITKCKFGFPRTVTKTTVLHDACDALKKRKKIYNLVRSEDEVRVNDYNPLLLMLWKANCDIQFIAESSLVQYTCALPQGLFTFDNLPLASSEVVCVHVPASCLIEYIFCYGIEKACYYTADHLHLRHSSSESDWST